MGVINLAHGSFYMIGAYMAFALAPLFGDQFIADAGRRRRCSPRVLGYVLEWALLQLPLPARPPAAGADDLRADPGVRGAAQHPRRQRRARRRRPPWLAGSIPLGDAHDATRCTGCSSRRVCLVLALGLYCVINRTRLGMMIRAGASNREMVRVAGHRHQAALPRRVRRRRGAGGVRRHDRRAGVVGVSRAWAAGADHLLRGGGDRRHRLDHAARWSRRCWSASSTPSARCSCRKLRGVAASTC